MKWATTANRKEWVKHERRITRMIDRAISKGYEVVEQILPERPQRVTKQALERIASINSMYVYNRLIKRRYDGKVMRGNEARTYYKSNHMREAIRKKKLFNYKPNMEAYWESVKNVMQENYEYIIEDYWFKPMRDIANQMSTPNDNLFIYHVMDYIIKCRKESGTIKFAQEAQRLGKQEIIRRLNELAEYGVCLDQYEMKGVI